jgi:uncharacterized membrane protein YvbJ
VPIDSVINGGSTDTAKKIAAAKPGELKKAMIAIKPTETSKEITEVKPVDPTKKNEKVTITDTTKRGGTFFYNESPIKMERARKDMDHRIFYVGLCR